MRTLLSVNTYHYRRGGADIVFLEENRLFEELGWRAIPFAMQHPKNLDSSWSEYFVDEIEFGHQYSLSEKIRKTPKVIYSLEARRKIRQLIRKAQPDVAHLHNIYHHISPSILSVLKKEGIPTVLTAHDLKVACPAYSMLTHDGVCERCKGGKLYQVAANKCIKNSAILSGIVMIESYLHHFLKSYRNNVDKIVTPSKFYKQKLEEWGWDPAQLVHVPNYVDVDQFQAEFTAGDYFVFFGRLSHEKGLHTMIRAAAAAGVKVRIVGTGPDEAELKLLSEKCGADVEFRGYRSGQELHDEVSQARAVVLPSEWYENGPLSVLESYALATPVIGADIGGIPEFIRSGETGAIFPSASVDGLATELRRFQEMPDTEIQEMGRCGRAWMEDEFTPLHYRQRIVDVFKSIGVSV